MINKRRSSSTSLITLMFLGFFAGIAFLVYDTFQDSPQSAALISQPLPSPSPFQLTATAPFTATDPAPENSATLALPESFQSIDDASIFIPAAGINAPIIRVFLNNTTWDVTELGMNVGHLQGTNWMQDNQPGNIVLSGHVEMRDGRAGIFAPIGDLNVGDVMFLRQGGAERRYVVQEIFNVQPDDLEPLYPSETDKLTLITCDNFSFGANAYQERTVVVAERIS